MIDIQSLMPQLSVLKQKTLAAEAAGSVSFDSVLSQKIDEVAGEAPAAISLDAIDAMSTLPDEIKTIIKDLANAVPKTDADLTTESKKLAVASRTLVEILNRTPGESESVEAEINLQVITFGIFQLLENYGYKPAVGDLVQTWKTLDMRTDAYQTLIDGLVDFIKKHACALKALKSDDTINTDVTYKKVTWEMQYSLWEELSVYGNTVRTQPLIKAFNENNQMASAKVDFDGEKIDSLIDPISPE